MGSCTTDATPFTREPARRRSRRRRRLAGAALTAAALLAAPATAARAQDSTTTSTTRLPEVEVRATRETARSPLDLPYAITSVWPDSARPGMRHLSLDEMLTFLPGVTVANRNNPAQDPRVSIRGFGSRSAFGVRGVRILRDGMPLTLPDGQTPVDYMDLESVGRVEVIRGSAAALYGNGAGGVIDVRSAPPSSDPLAVQLRGLSGSDGLRRWVGALGGSAGRLGYQGNVAHTESDGYRDYATQRATTGFGRATLRAGATTFGATAIVYDSPYAEDPGALTATQLDTNARMADPLWVLRRVRKSARQNQVGLSATRTAGGGDVSANVYGGTRSLFNARPTFVIDLDRTSYGGSVRGTRPVRVGGLTHRLSAGVDAQHQADDRRNDANCNGVATPTANCATPGVERGARLLDQTERVTSVGPFARDEVDVGDRYRLTVGARGDWVRFGVRDHLVSGTNPDDSGDRTLHRVSPMVGAVARLGRFHAAYANVASAFETPTASELTTKPDGSGGINSDLKPQFATTYELGVKGFAAPRVRYDVATFYTRVQDELIQYDVPSVPGRSYYRNAGRTDRRGAELGLGAFAGPLEVSGAYSYSRFRFARYVVGTSDFAGRTVPGIPAHQGQLGLTLHHRAAYATAEMLAASSAPVDDANAHRIAGYAVVNVRAGAVAAFGKPWLSPVVGVYNLLDRSYAGSAVVNAAGGKYYEPAPRRSLFVGLTAAVGR